MMLSVAYIGPKSRTERPRKTKIGTEVAHVTRDSDTTFKVKGQGHQAALLTAALPRQAAAAVSMGTYWLLRSAHAVGSAARSASAPTRRRAAVRYSGGRLPTACFTLLCEWDSKKVADNILSCHCSHNRLPLDAGQ